LHQDVVIQAELNDVPDDQEISFETELLDQVELALDLMPGFVVVRTETFERAFFGSFAKKRGHGFAVADGIFGKLITEIFQCELQPLRKLDGVGDRFGYVVKKPGHLCRRFQMTFGIYGKQASGGFERSMIPNACEDIEDFAL